MRAQALAWAPFDETAYRAVAQGNRAVLFGWDKVQVDALLRDGGWLSPDASAPTLWPETLWQAPPESDGVRAVACAQGVDYQCWLNGALVDSRWWAEPPAQEEWQAWLRSVPCRDAPLRPEARPAPALQRPWGAAHNPVEVGARASALQRWATAAVALLLVVATGHQARAAWDLGRQAEHLAQEQARRAATSAPIDAARRKAVALAGDAHALSALLAGVQPLELLKHFADQLAGQAVVLTELEFAGDRVALSIEPSPTTQRAALVKALQDGGVFEQVAESRDAALPTWWRFDMRIKSGPAQALSGGSDQPTARADTPAAGVQR